MARRRMIDPNIWQSEDFSKLSVLARLLFIGMFSMADDEGKGRAKPVFLRSILFPYDEAMRLIDVEKALSEIGTNMSVTFYKHNENDYYIMNNWKTWQRVDKPQPSLIPDPKPFENHSGISPESVQNDSCLKERKGKEENIKEKNIKKERDTPHTREDTQKADEIIFTEIDDYSAELNECGNYYMQVNGKPIPSEYQREILMRLQSGVEVMLITECIKLSANKHVSYFRKIMQNWYADGVKTYRQYCEKNNVPLDPAKVELTQEEIYKQMGIDLFIPGVHDQ